MLCKDYSCSEFSETRIKKEELKKLRTRRKRKKINLRKVYSDTCLLNQNNKGRITKTGGGGARVFIFLRDTNQSLTIHLTIQTAKHRVT